MALAPDENPARPEGEGGRRLLTRMNGGKHAVLSEFGFSHLAVPDDAQALDIGCGGGANVERLLARATTGHVWGVDYAPTSVEMAREHNAGAIRTGRCTVEQGDAADLPFGDNQLDVITAFETVYFWPDIRAAFAEVRRVLKPGGAFMVCNEVDGTAPADHEQERTIEGLTMYTIADLEALLKESGFSQAESYENPENRNIAVIAR